MRTHRAIALALALALVAIAAPAAAQPGCDTYDSGLPRPASDPNPDVACGGPGFVPPPAAPEVPGSLTTSFNANNSFAGNTFDLLPAVDMTITGFDINLGTGTTTTVTIYWRNGTAQGFESNPAGWNVLGVDNAVTPAGLNLPTPVAIGGLTLTAGQTYGIYLDVTSYPSASLQYTNGGPTTFSNADLSLTTYHGKGNPAFTGSSFFPRQWNGTVYYDTITACTLALTCPGNQTATAPPGAGSAVVTFPDPTFTGTCTNPTITCVPASGDLFPVGTTAVVCTGIEGDTTETCTFDVTVEAASVLEVPTLAPAGLAGLGLLLAGGAIALLRRRRA